MVWGELSQPNDTEACFPTFEPAEVGQTERSAKNGKPTSV